MTTLGNLCLSGQLWGQAELYLTRSLARRSDARVHALLASLFDKIERPQEAATQWRLATAVSTVLPVLATDSFLPAADTGSDPGVLHAEGLAYLTDSGFPVQWAQGDRGVQAESPGDANTLPANPNFASRSNELDEYFDSAPVAHLGEPAAVAPYAGHTLGAESSGAAVAPASTPAPAAHGGQDTSQPGLTKG